MITVKRSSKRATKLPRKKHAEIIAARLSGESQKAVAQKHGVSEATVSKTLHQYAIVLPDLLKQHGNYIEGIVASGLRKLHQAVDKAGPKDMGVVLEALKTVAKIQATADRLRLTAAQTKHQADTAVGPRGFMMFTVEELAAAIAHRRGLDAAAIRQDD